MIRLHLFVRPGLATLASVAVLLVGCVSQAPLVRDVDASAQRSAVEPLYQGDDVRRQLMDLGLMPSFGKYWAAYGAADWRTRYEMEQFQSSVERDFYVAYHHAAWQMLELRVDAVVVSNAPERVRVSLQVRFRNPSRLDQERTTFIQDLWSKNNNQWVHVNSDPMLNGLRAVK